MKVLEPRLDIKPIAIQATLEEIAKTDPRAKQVTASQLIDRRFLDEMEKEGRSGGEVCGIAAVIRIMTM